MCESLSGSPACPQAGFRAHQRKEFLVNLLIIGGLLIVAAAAIIDAVLIGMTEQRTERARNGRLKQPTSTASSDLSARKLMEEPTTTASRPNFPTTRESNLPSSGEDQRLSSLNGQF